MVNYTFIDTGPPVHTPTKKPRTSNHQRFRHKNEPQGSPPQFKELSPPDFFEPGNRTRWFLLLLPVCQFFYHNKEIPAHSFSIPTASLVHCSLSICCATITLQALLAKRRVLYNYLYTEPTACEIDTARAAYQMPANTTTAALLSIATGIAIIITQYLQGHTATFTILCTTASIIFFTLLYYRFSYRKCRQSRPWLFPSEANNSNPINNLKNKNYE